MHRIVKRADHGGISFLELLLNENLCSGAVWIETRLVSELGGINTYLAVKRKYELLLRAALDTNIELCEENRAADRQYEELLDDHLDALKADGWKTDCYVIGKYSGLLRENGLFDACLNEVINEAEQEGRLNATLAYLEKMIGRTGVYQQIDEGSKPILIYREGRDECDVLNVFSDQMGRALEHAGKKVILYDCKKNGAKQWADVCMEQHFQAVIAMQSTVFCERASRGHKKYLHDYVYGPKFNYIFDHTVMMYEYLREYDADDFYLLSHDAGHAAFAERYLKKKTYLFPLAGVKSGDRLYDDTKRCYDITFIGTYKDYRKEICAIHQMNRRIRFLANHFLLKMRSNTYMTAEQALLETLDDRGSRCLSDEAFAELLYSLRSVISCVMNYYREKAVRVLLEGGIGLDVFGDSWMECPLRRFSNLRCHPSVNVQESIAVWQKSKLSLNVMSWHKSGYTERVAQIMLEKAVLVTDATAYLEQTYGENDMLSFQLDELERLPEQVGRLLSDSGLRQKMAENGWRKTVTDHTWDIRAGQFLDILRSRAAGAADCPKR